VFGHLDKSAVYCSSLAYCCSDAETAGDICRIRS